MQLFQRNNSLIPGFVSLVVSRPIAVSMAVLAICVFGVVAYRQLPVSLMPEISYPTITIRTEYPGSAPEEVEKNITEPIEEALAATSNLLSHSSVSRSGLSDVVLEFMWNTDMPVVVQEIREKLDRIRLPREAQRPLILRYDPSLDPIMRIGLFSKKTSLYKLRDIAELEIKRALETVQGIASVKIKGGLEEEIRIDLHEKTLSARGIPISRVIQRINEENINTPCGTLREGDRGYLVRTQNEFKTLEEMRSLLIKSKNGVGIPLRDIAQVVRTHKDKEIITRVEGQDAVEIEIYKEADANIIHVAEAIKIKLFGPPEEREKRKNEKRGDKKVEKKQGKKKSKMRLNRRGKFRSRERNRSSITWVTAELPKGVQLELLSDQSRFIEQAVQEVINTCILGGFLAVFILYIFLRHAKSTIIIAVAIPISIISTFAPLHLSRTSLNIMSLGGLALGIGMLVDNAIVVLESIVRCRNEGDSIAQSAIRGTYEVGGAITASTLTTIAVFFPILYLEGIAGQIFTDQALTVVFSLLASLATALVVIPMLASRELRQHSREQWQMRNYWQFLCIDLFRQNFAEANFFQKGFAILVLLLALPLEVAGKIALLAIHLVMLAIKWIIIGVSLGFSKLFSPLLAFLYRLGNRGQLWYSHILHWSLDNVLAVLCIILILSATAVFCLFSFIGSELIPELHQGEFNILVAMPVGFPLEKTDSIIAEFEKFLLEKPHIRDKITKVFSKSGVEKTSTTSTEEGEHTGIITCVLDTEVVPAWKEDEFIQDLRESIQGFPDIKSVRFSRPSLFSLKTPIEIQIYGYDLRVAKQIAENAVETLRTIPGLYDLKISLEKGNPEYQIAYNRRKLFKHELRLADVATTIRRKIQGESAGKFRTPEKEIAIVVRLAEEHRSHLRDLENIVIGDDLENPTYLRDVGDIMEEEGPSEIRHLSQRRVVLIHANLYGLDLQGMAEKIEERLVTMEWPKGCDFYIGGQRQEQQAASQGMKFALILAAFLVYVIMASQFESLLQPLIIMCTLPLAFIGVIFALALFHIPISIIVLIGVIVLAGIVVNNAIVMVDCINQLRDKGMALEEAVAMGAKIRLRPILMTTLTTVLGLLPMTGILPMGGEGIEIRSPLAITVTSGLISSTLLTLLVIPTVYMWIEKIKNRFTAT